MRLLPIAIALVVAGTTLCHAQSTDTGEPISKPPATVNVEEVPDHNDFTPVETEASYDVDELQSHIHYPPEAREHRIEGHIIVRALIDKRGQVRKTIIDLSDNKVLEEAGIEAVKATRFTPAATNGTPVATWKQIEVVFKLAD